MSADKTVYYQVRAHYHDYELGERLLQRDFGLLRRALEFRGKINEYIADEERKYIDDEGRSEKHREEELAWFDSGSGYFTSKPTIVEITEKPIDHLI